MLVSEDGAKLLAKEATAKDFVSDAFARCKYIAYMPEAAPLLEKAGIASDLDKGCVEIKGADAWPASSKAAASSATGSGSRKSIRSRL